MKYKPENPRVWFNHWFSSVYDLIELLKQAYPNAVIIGSNFREQAIYKEVCDEWYREDPVNYDEKEYLKWCLRFCKANKIDIFIPKKMMAIISKNKAAFENIGVEVMVDPYLAIEPFFHKSTTYKYFSENNIGPAPDYFLVNNAEDFKIACNTLYKKYKNICMKYNKDEGATSFRKLTKYKVPGMNSILSNEYSVQEVYEAIKAEKTIYPIIVMPYMSSEEVSVDCLATDKGYIIIPRYKYSTRHERIHFDPEIMKICKKFLNYTKLQYPVNLQFRYIDDVPYILDVNVGMSDELYLACLGTGVNIPSIAFGKIYDKTNIFTEPVENYWVNKEEDVIVSHVEKPLLIF